MKKLLYFYLLFWGFPQVYAQGLRMNPEDIQKYKNYPTVIPLTKAGGMDLRTGGTKVMPKKYSLKKYCPPVQNQIGNSCTAWAVGYYAHTILEAVQNNQEYPSYQNAFSPTWIYEKIPKDYDYKNCIGLTSLLDALTLLRDSGDVKIKDLPYECGGSINEQHKKIAQNFKIQGLQKVFVDADAEKIDKNLKLGAVKLAISNKTPVVLAWETTEDFSAPLLNNGIWQKSNNTTGNKRYHAMAVIAYDDDKQAFQLVNSWGDKWADGGFIWVNYEDFHEFAKLAFTAIPFEKQESSGGGIVPRNLDFTADFNLFYDSQPNMPIKRNTGNSFAQYRFVNNYKSGTQFQFTCQTQAPVYVYVIATDKEDTVTRVFPLDNTFSPLIPYQNSAFVFPSPDSNLYLDNNVGLEYFCFLLSFQEIDFDNLIRNMKRQEGNFYQKLRKVLGNRLVDFELPSYEENKIGLHVPLGNHDNSVVPIFVELNHIR